MMKRTNVNYPYPVLNSSNEDYIDCSFNIISQDEIIINGDNLEFSVEYELASNGLKELIDNEKAKVVLYCESVEAEYRKIKYYEQGSTCIKLSIDKNDLSKNLEIRGYIIATSNIYPFRLDEHNHDLFGGVPFKIGNGDILAISNDFIQVPIKYYDPLANRPSIFSIRRGTNPDQEIAIDVSTDKITILLYDDIYNSYFDCNQEPKIKTIISSMFATSVLVDVLSFIKHCSADDLEDIKDKKWYQVISSRLETLEINIASEDYMTKVANLVLPHVYKSFVDSVKNTFEGLIRGEEE
jgi:hypothetical protein